MRIDLRYIIVIGVFYAPGVLMLIGALALGYSLAEVGRLFAVMGATFWGALRHFGCTWPVLWLWPDLVARVGPSDPAERIAAHWAQKTTLMVRK